MSFAKTVGALALAGLVGLSVFTVGCVTQRAKAESDFRGPRYVQTMKDRLHNPGGFGLRSDRDSSVVAAAMPHAPAEWAAEDWTGSLDGYLFSWDQSQAFDEEITKATRHIAQPAGLSEVDDAVWEAYLADISKIYIKDKSLIGLQVNDLTRQIDHPYWADHLAAIDGYFANVDQRVDFGVYQDATWYERHGPIEGAGNGFLPHRLRTFETTIGVVDVLITARAPHDHIESFLKTVDLTGIRSLSTDRTGQVALSLTAELALVPTDAAPITADRTEVNLGLD